MHIDNIELHSSAIFKKATLNKVQSNIASLFQLLFIFLYPPSLISLTTTEIIGNRSTSFCTIDNGFQRDIVISFTDGKIY